MYHFGIDNDTPWQSIPSVLTLSRALRRIAHAYSVRPAYVTRALPTRASLLTPIRTLIDIAHHR
jgi:hypothetical protein